MRARASARRWRAPPLREERRCERKASSSGRRASRITRLTRSTTSAFGSSGRLSSSGSATISRSVILGLVTSSGSCSTQPVPCASASLSAGTPSRRISPESGAMAPARSAPSVLLPAPLSPMTTSVSPATTESETSESTSTPPRCFVRRLASIRVAMPPCRQRTSPSPTGLSSGWIPRHSSFACGQRGAKRQPRQTACAEPSWACAALPAAWT